MEAKEEIITEQNKEFVENIRQYLGMPLQLKDGYIIYKAIYEIGIGTTNIGIRFRIMDRIMPSKKNFMRHAYGRPDCVKLVQVITDTDKEEFFYTFTSKISLEQNIEEFEEFVKEQWENSPFSRITLKFDDAEALEVGSREYTYFKRVRWAPNEFSEVE